MAKKYVSFKIDGPEFAPLRAYAESQGISPAQAAHELIMISLGTNVTDALFLANARSIRYMIMKIGLDAGVRAANMMREELRARLISMGVTVEDLP